MNRIIFSMPGNEQLSGILKNSLKAGNGEAEFRSFPDGETYLRVLSDVKNKDIIVVCTLHEPNKKLLSLLFLCRLLRDLEAKSICLVSPYLAYMRQDKQFKPGEAVTSKYVAALLSSFTDRLLTIDPHLHRRSSMQEIYSIPCDVMHASAAIAGWIKHNIPRALLIGPDSESRQWVSEVAETANIPFIILEKIRSGDHEVTVSVPQVEKFKDHTPVLIDDIISTGRTMIETIRHLKKAGMKAPVCIAVHAVFTENAYNDLLSAGAARVITCNTINHESNAIDISGMLVQKLLNE